MDKATDDNCKTNDYYEDLFMNNIDLYKFDGSENMMMTLKINTVY